MSKWPQTPLITAMTAILEETKKGENVQYENNQKEGVAEVKIESILEKAIQIVDDTMCTKNATVICSNATDGSEPVKIEVEEGTVSVGRFYLLKRTDVKLKNSFRGCKKSEEGICKIAENYLDWILDDEWKAVNTSSGQGEGNETLSREHSYMICKEHLGIIYFHDDGQAVKDNISDILSDLMEYEVSTNGIDLVMGFELTEEYAKATGIGAFDENGQLIGIYPHYVFVWDEEHQVYRSDGGITFGFGHYINQAEYESSTSERNIIDKYNLTEQFAPPFIPQNGESYKVPGSAFMPIEEAKILLGEDLTLASEALNGFLRRNADRKIILEQHQFDALVCFTHQYGTGWWSKSNEDMELPKLLLEGRYKNNEEVKRVFELHDYKNRRAVEADIFINGY